MSAGRLLSVFVLGLGLSSCNGCPEADVSGEQLPDLTAGRSPKTIFFSGNMWGDLLECG